MKYRRKHATVEAIQYIGANEDKVLEFIGRGDIPHYGSSSQLMIPIGGNTGVMILSIGEWAVKHPDGGVSVMNDAQFTAVYEPDEETW